LAFERARQGMAIPAEAPFSKKINSLAVSKGHNGALKVQSLPTDCLNPVAGPKRRQINHLPMFRLALVMLSRNPKELEASMAELVVAGMAPKLLDDLCIVKQKFADMSHFMDAAISRSFLMLERLGYGPDNPPPDESEVDFDGEDEGSAA